MTSEGGGAEGISALSYQAGGDASNTMRTAFEGKRRPRGSVP